MLHGLFAIICSRVVLSPKKFAVHSSRHPFPHTAKRTLQSPHPFAGHARHVCKCRPHHEDGPHCVNHCCLMDVGSHIAAVNYCRLPIWVVWPLLLCGRGYGPGAVGCRCIVHRFVVLTDAGSVSGLHIVGWSCLRLSGLESRWGILGIGLWPSIS